MNAQTKEAYKALQKALRNTEQGSKLISNLYRAIFDEAFQKGSLTGREHGWKMACIEFEKYSDDDYEGWQNL